MCVPQAENRRAQHPHKGKELMQDFGHRLGRSWQRVSPPLVPCKGGRFPPDRLGVRSSRVLDSLLCTESHMPL